MRNLVIASSLAVAVAATGVTAVPTCTTVPTAACGNRVIAEPLLSATFIQYGSEAWPALRAIEAIAPDVVDVKALSELTRNKAHVSAGGRQIPVIRVTNEKVRGPKKKVVVSLSAHGNEPAGREGGLRYVENLARWAKTDPKHKLYAGDVAMPLDAVLAKTEIWLSVINVDGWANGDVVNGGVFERGNGNGEDLNREFPTVGWTNREATPMSEPEAQGWVQLVRSLGKIATATDIHGELTSKHRAFAELMWPAGQWSPKMPAEEAQLAKHAIRSIERKFEEQLVVAGMAADVAGVFTPSKVATGYDVVGYDDGGFMGDWFTQERGAVEIDAENFLSHTVPMSGWVGALEQIHVAGVQGLIEALVVEAHITDKVRPNLKLGRVAYAFDPRRVRSSDGLGFQPEPGDRPRAYDVSRMRYFDDLRAVSNGAPVVPLSSYDIATGRARLSSYDSLVLADVAMPPDPRGRRVDAAAYRRALQTFVRNGGQLVLTDEAVPYVRNFGIGGDSALRSALTNAGHIDFGTDRTHAWEKGLSDTSSQTYYEVPLGFAPTGSAPHFGVTTEDWAKAKGVTVGTVTDKTGAFTALGSMPYGRGQVAIFGALLPTPSEEEDHVMGIKDYGVTITGGLVFHSILGYRRR